MANIAKRCPYNFGNNHSDMARHVPTGQLVNVFVTKKSNPCGLLFKVAITYSSAFPISTITIGVIRFDDSVIQHRKAMSLHFREKPFRHGTPCPYRSIGACIRNKKSNPCGLLFKVAITYSSAFAVPSA